MSINIYTTNNAEEWSEKINRLPKSQQDIFITPEYYQLFEQHNISKAYCFVYEDMNGLVIYPFLKNKVKKLKLINNKKEFYDIEGAWGYNGAFAASKSATLINNFNKEFVSYCKANDIIAEFTRFNPILENHLYSNYLNIKKANQNIILNLKKDQEEIWRKSFEHSVRKNYRQAVNNKLKVKHIKAKDITNQELNSFIKIYTSTLNRRKATKYYYFKKFFFKKLIVKLGNKCSFFFTIYKKNFIACELILHNNENAYSYLGGTMREYYNLRPNDIIKIEIINYLKKKNFKYFCLGGGHNKNDGIFNYKKRFSQNGVHDFYIGTKIYNKKIYDELVFKWSKKFPEKLKTLDKHFLRYRK